MYRDKNWAHFSAWIRNIYKNCQWCGVHSSKYRTGYLEGHHLGTRGHGNNKEYRLCPFNIIVVCQTCHTMLEPFAKVRVQLTLVDDLDNEIKEVECCGKGTQCDRFKERLLK